MSLLLSVIVALCKILEELWSFSSLCIHSMDIVHGVKRFFFNFFLRLIGYLFDYFVY